MGTSRGDRDPNCGQGGQGCNHAWQMRCPARPSYNDLDPPLVSISRIVQHSVWRPVGRHDGQLTWDSKTLYHLSPPREAFNVRSSNHAKPTWCYLLYPTHRWHTFHASTRCTMLLILSLHLLHTCLTAQSAVMQDLRLSKIGLALNSNQTASNMHLFTMSIRLHNRILYDKVAEGRKWPGVGVG